MWLLKMEKKVVMWEGNRIFDKHDVDKIKMFLLIVWFVKVKIINMSDFFYNFILRLDTCFCIHVSLFL